MSGLIPFTAVAPGLMIFSVLLLSVYTATSLAREVETRSLGRYRLAGAGLGSLIRGNIGAQMVLATIAFALMFGAAYLVGLPIKGDLFAAFAVVLLTSLASIGTGLLVASFVRRREDAAYLALLVSLPMGFLNGGFFPLPKATVAGTPGWDLYAMLPASHAVAALKSVLGGSSFAAVSGELAALAVLGLFMLTIGSMTFWWRRYRTAL